MDYTDNAACRQGRDERFGVHRLIADRLTRSAHVSSLLVKLGVDNRLQAAVRALRARIV
ncbi:MAG: hypothetical protein ABSH51_06790 [Solirubrobacteraceae bacterium]